MAKTNYLFLRAFISVILLIAHLFAIGVYCGAFDNKDNAEAQLIKQPYQSKTHKDLVELKIPVHMPGMSNWVAYENVLGQIKLKNAEYTYVSMKMTHDTMSLICINSSKKANLANANIIDAKAIADVPIGKKAHTFSRKISDTQYNSLPFQCCFSSVIVFVNECICREYIKLSDPFLETRGQPPDYSC